MPIPGQVMSSDRSFRRLKQCKACPWRVDVEPAADIPGGYAEDLHEGLCHLREGAGLLEPGRIMACHESPVGDEFACVGWLVHELGPGNNIGLRLMVRGRLAGPLETVGEQHACIEDTLPKGRA